MKFIVLILALGLSLPTFAARIGLSPIRHADEDFETARNKQFFKRIYNYSLPELSPYFYSSTPEGKKKPLKSLNTSEIPDIGSYSDLENQFFYIRDTRFIETRDPNFPRRMTWLYPDDGCYARAEMAKYKLDAHNFPSPKKIFVFGNLSVNSKNSILGQVTWWYHVAVTYRVAETVYVFDPAIEPSRPLTLTEWDELMGGAHARTQYAICNKNTFDPSADCTSPRVISYESALAEQVEFLDYEWTRLLHLKRDPRMELGDFPPWLNN